MQEIFVEGRERRRLFRPNDLSAVVGAIGNLLLEPIMDKIFGLLPEQTPPKKHTRLVTSLGLVVARTTRTETVAGSVYGSTTSLAIYDKDRKLITLRGFSQARDEPHKLAVLRALDFFNHPTQLYWSENRNTDLELICLYSKSGSSLEPSLVTVHGGAMEADSAERQALDVSRALLGFLDDSPIDMYRPRCSVDQNISDREHTYRP